MRWQDMTLCGKRINHHKLMAGLILFIFLAAGCSNLHAASDSPASGARADVELPKAENIVERVGSVPGSPMEKPSDEYGNVTEEEVASGSATLAQKPTDDYGNVTEEEASGGESPRIADPIEPFNRAMYHVNDKLYFWLLKPAATGYKYAVNEDFRGLFSNFYQNLKAPIRIVNNFLQGKLGYAGIELARFVVNSTVGVVGLRDCAKECFGINGRDADFGQTLGKYGVGFGFYIVWPVLGPSSPRDTVGWMGDWLLRPQSYVSSQTFSYEATGLYVHEQVNYTSLHLGDYEALKQAAIDPYVAMRDAYVQYRKKLIEK
jgi:phospholipid-binding lipoprotein MlaA